MTNFGKEIDNLNKQIDDLDKQIEDASFQYEDFWINVASKTGDPQDMRLLIELGEKYKDLLDKKIRLMKLKLKIEEDIAKTSEENEIFNGI